MPLFNYKCTECDHVIEKFQHTSNDLDIVCKECGANCEKLLSFSHNQVWLDAKDMLDQKIGPDARKIMDKMKNGDDEAFFDIYGEK